MTDQELKDLVASLAVSQAKTDAQMARTDAKLEKMIEESDARFAKIEAQMAKSFEKSDARFEKTEAQMAKSFEKSDARFEKTEAQMARTDARLDKIAKMVGGISNNQGDITEEYFINSLKDKLTLGDIKFDFLVENFKAKKGRKILAEYDILLVNGKSVAIIEVKYKVHPSDLEKLPAKIASIRNLPQYDAYEVYAGLAGFFVPDKVIEEAEKKGYFVLQRKGDVVVTHVDNLQAA